MTPADVFAVMEATWPPAAVQRIGPWMIRDGAGGGKRVSAATVEAEWTDADLPLAESAMRGLGQDRLFLIRAGDAALDTALAAHGYCIVDPVTVYACPVADLAAPPGMTTFPHWPPLAIARDLWAEGGIGAARVAVMNRAAGPKTAILARNKDRPAGVAFVALHGRHAMLHALEITPSQRRQGSAHHIVQAAARWALDHGAITLSLAVTTDNTPARALYASLGMQAVGHYHYRETQARQEANARVPHPHPDRGLAGGPDRTRPVPDAGVSGRVRSHRQPGRTLDQLSTAHRPFC